MRQIRREISEGLTIGGLAAAPASANPKFHAARHSKIRAKAQIIGQLEGDLAVLRAKQYQELSKVLPKEQLERFQLNKTPRSPPEVRELRTPRPIARRPSHPQRVRQMNRACVAEQQIRAAIIEHGPSPLHRRSFASIAYSQLRLG